MKTAVIIGATGGIGSSLSRKLAELDYKLILISRSAKKLEVLQNEIGNDHTSYVCNLANIDEVEKTVSKIAEETDAVDLLINAAGVATYKNLTHVSSGELKEAFNVNVISPAIIIREFIPLMQQKSLVLNIGSGAGKIAMRVRSIYCSTKYALRGLSLSLSEEYKGKSPNFCLITLGSTLTDFGPKSLREKQEAAKKGKAYFPVDWVTKKLVEIINDPDRETEIILYPSEHGFGEWKKP